MSLQLLAGPPALLTEGLPGCLCADIVNIDEERVAAVGTAVYMAFKHLPKEERAASTCKLTP